MKDNTRNRVPAADEGRSGSVRFDDRGNAIWQWSGDAPASGSLSALVDDLVVAEEPIVQDLTINEKGLAYGYNPYQSGVLYTGEREKRPKRDLRELSKWIAMKKGVPPKK
jgi:hypothetical protein